MTKTIWALLAAGFILSPLVAQLDRGAPQKLRAFEEDIGRLGAEALKSTVGLQVGRSTGSGVIVSEDGHVLTAAHLFSEPGLTARVTMWDGSVVQGETLGRMVRDDYAMVRITSKGKWTYAELGRSRGLASGSLCVGTGHPGGVQKGRSAPLRLGQILSTRGRFIRTTCTIDLGDSGGPLFDLEGRVIAVHSRIGRSTRQNWHVPVDRYRANWKRLTEREVWGVADFPDGPIIGIHGDGGPGGTRVERVYPDLPAMRAGIREGDVIVRAAGRAIDAMDELKEVIARHEIGDELVLNIKRGDEILEKTLVLAAPPGAAASSADARGMPVVETPADDAIALLFGDSTNLSEPFEDLATRSRSSIVTIESEAERDILGTVVGAQGLVLTKASEVTGDATCVLADGRRVGAARVDELPRHDLLLLKIEASGLEPVRLEPTVSLERGRFLVSVGPGDDDVEVGVVSVEPRRVLGRGGFLGVELEETQGRGVRIARVMDDTAAQRARLQANDVILAIGGVYIENREDLIERISSNSPRTRISLKVLRGEEELEAEAILGSRWPSRQRDGRSWGRGRRASWGPRYSQRKDGFDLAVQHDALIRASECGGPVFDVNGRCVGINIARASRYGTLAVPSSVIVPLLEPHLGKTAENR